MYFPADVSCSFFLDFFFLLSKNSFGCCGIKAYLIVTLSSGVVLNALVFVARNMERICLHERGVFRGFDSVKTAERIQKTYALLQPSGERRF